MSKTRSKLLSGVVPHLEPESYRTGDGAKLLAVISRIRDRIHPDSRLSRLLSSGFLVMLLVMPSLAWAFEIRQAGKLEAPPHAQLFAFSTDPTIQEVLSQDFSAASRGPDTVGGATVTVSVNVTQQMLRPGVSLAQLAPGDPQVADLMRAAGANPPPLGDTGSQYDEAALARRMASRDYMPNDTQSARLVNSVANPGGFSEGIGPPIPIPCGVQGMSRPGCPPAPQGSPVAAATATRSVGDVQQYVERRKQSEGWLGSHENNDYDTVVVARASVSGAAEEMTLVAVSHPGEDVDDAKKHVAERIANSILH
jgi:hypothetical protein